MFDIPPFHAYLWDSVQSLFHPFLNPLPKSLPPNGGVPVFIMLPLDVVCVPCPAITESKFHSYLKQLADIGVHGVMLDVWWRFCEPNPGQYEFSEYIRLAKTCRSLGLKLQAVMSFHACGGNVGDSVNIPLPEWVISAGEEHKFWFTDRSGAVNKEYISFGADHEYVLPSSDVTSRTPLQAYGSFIQAFVTAMEEEGLMGVTVTELQIGLGPCGELRYPSYPMSRWEFPGIGEFQCYDKYLMGDLMATIREKGDEPIKAATLPPNGAGTYNDKPSSTDFFKKQMHKSEGKFFLKWYSDRLLEHGEDVLTQVRNVVPRADGGVEVAVKIAGIHWWKLSRNRAAEATSGYFGDGTPVYNEIAKLICSKGAVFDFTCLEMRSIDQPLWARCGPRQLVNEVFNCAWQQNVPVAGENALQDFSKKAFKQILYSMRSTKAEKKGFTLLRLCDDLMEEENLKSLETFVKDMGSIQNLRQ